MTRLFEEFGEAAGTTRDDVLAGVRAVKPDSGGDAVEARDEGGARGRTDHPDEPHAGRGPGRCVRRACQPT